MNKFIFAAMLVVAIGVAVAHKGYQLAIPNGAHVPDPCGHGTWGGVGHLNSHGTGVNNKFGLDFAAHRHNWTQALCMADSDSDGKTNGFELGDPFCVWHVGVSPHSGAISHPGAAGRRPTMDMLLLCNTSHI